MKFSKKTLLMAACMMLCVTMTALGTVAYLTDRDSVANTFTVGKINITVDEADVDKNGDPLVKVDTKGNGFNENDDDDKVMTEEEAMTKHPGKETQELPRVTANEYKLIPGGTYTKDPTMTVTAGSEDCYVRMIVKINMIDTLKEVFGNDFLPQNYVKGWDPTVWISTKEIEKITEDGKDWWVYEFRYYEAVPSPEDDLELPALFTEIEIPKEIPGDQLAKLDGLDIKVEGHAIQTAAFNGDVNAAWNAFDAQHGETGTGGEGNGNGNSGEGNNGEGGNTNSGTDTNNGN